MKRSATPHAQAPTSDPSLGDAVYGQLLADRIIYLGSEVTNEVANRITAQLLVLAGRGDEEITFYINSPGGSVTAGMAVYDTMRLVTPDVATIGLGFVASMGQFLLPSGTPGKRWSRSPPTRTGTAGSTPTRHWPTVSWTMSSAPRALRHAERHDQDTAKDVR
jgi:ATP-dependent protease ClpP protease subunit